MTRRHLVSRTLPGWAIITRGQFVDLFLEVSPGIYELRGMPATLVTGTQFMGEAGVYVLEGQGAAFKRSLLLPAGAGQYILAGQSATLDPGFTMVAGSGAYTVEGQQAALLRDLNVLAAAGEYVLAGQPADLKRAGISPASPGGYMLSGQAADFASVDVFTVLLLHFDGTDGSTTIVDSSASAHSVTTVGQAQIDTAQSKFGGASLLLDGDNDNIQVPASGDFNFGTADFTIDFWVRFASAARQYIFDRSTANQAVLAITPSSGVVEIYGPSSHVINADGGDAFSTGVWYHIALVRSGNSWTVYRDGVSFVSATDSRSWGASNTSLVIGTSGAGTVDFAGHIDEFRVSKGIARWTADFTPPAAAYA